MDDKIHLLNNYFKLLLPHKGTTNQAISEGIERLIEKCKSEVDRYGNKCIKTYDKIKDYKRRLGPESVDTECNNKNENAENNCIAKIDHNSIKQHCGDSKPNTHIITNDKTKVDINNTDCLSTNNSYNSIAIPKTFFSGLKNTHDYKKHRNFEKDGIENDTIMVSNQNGKIDDKKHYTYNIDSEVTCTIKSQNMFKNTSVSPIAALKTKFGFANVVLMYEYLLQEEKRLYFKMVQLFYKANRIIVNIQTMQKYLHIDDHIINKNIDNIDLVTYHELEAIHLEYKNKVLEAEKQRTDVYKKTLIIYKELELEAYTSIDKQIINDYTSIDKQIINDYTSVEIHKLIDRYNELVEEKKTREIRVKELIDGIQALINMLKEFHPTNYVLETTTTVSNIKVLETTHTELTNIYQAHFANIFADKHTQLTTLCTFFNIKMTEFTKTPENLEIMSNIITELTLKKQSHIKILDLKKEHNDLKQKMIEFEKNASDPRRLFRSSFQLMSEERFRKSAYPNLLNLENKMLEMIGVYEDSFGVFEYEGKCLREMLNVEIKDRITNRNVFMLNRNETTPKKR